jgi:hypothetical protein
MLIGEALGLDFGRYALFAVPPVLGGLALTWGVIAALTRGRWRTGTAARCRAAAGPRCVADRQGPGRGGALLVLFLWAPWPRELLALAAPGSC